MQLTLRSDHALRLLMYCAVDGGRAGARAAPVSRIARACNVSEAHLAKIAHQLSVLGFVETLRGRGGGVRLARTPAEINVGAVVRATECGSLVPQCDAAGADACALHAACRFRGALAEALAAFMGVLDRYTLADLTEQNPRLAELTGHVLHAVPPAAAQRARDAGRAVAG